MHKSNQGKQWNIGDDAESFVLVRIIFISSMQCRAVAKAHPHASSQWTRNSETWINYDLWAATWITALRCWLQRDRIDSTWYRINAGMADLQLLWALCNRQELCTSRFMNISHVKTENMGRNSWTMKWIISQICPDGFAFGCSCERIQLCGTSWNRHLNPTNLWITALIVLNVAHWTN